MSERLAFSGFMMLFLWAMEVAVGDGVFTTSDLAGIGLSWLGLGILIGVVRRCWIRLTPNRPEGQE